MPETSKKFLIVEDEPFAQETLSKKLTSAGFEVKVAADGEMGSTTFEEFRPDLIVLDLYMPVMDGHTFLNKLRMTVHGSEVPVIVLSNIVSPENVMSAFGRNIVDYLLKSNIGLDSLVTRIKSALHIQ